MGGARERKRKMKQIKITQKLIIIVLSVGAIFLLYSAFIYVLVFMGLRRF